MPYSENIHYAYNFYGTDVYVSVCRDVFRTQQNICGGDSLRKLQKSFIVDVRMGSKYVSGITFTVRKVTECQYLSDIVNVTFVRVIEKFVIDLLSLINKKHVGLRKV